MVDLYWDRSKFHPESQLMMTSDEAEEFTSEPPSPSAYRLHEESTSLPSESISYGMLLSLINLFTFILFFVYLFIYLFISKTLDTIGNGQRPVISLGVYLNIMNKITNM